MALNDELRIRLLENLDIHRELSDGDLMNIISNMVADEYKDSSLSASDRIKTVNDLFNSIRGLDILEDILYDDAVTEIMINGPDVIFIEKYGKISRYDGKFSSQQKLSDIIQNIVGRTNKRVNEASPIADTRLKDGSRVNVVLAPIALNGPAVTIRKFPETSITMENLISLNSLTREAAVFLKGVVEKGANIFISGGTGSGKTTFLNALSDYIPKNERIITIEDSAELRLKGVSNLVSLECRQANTEGENEITIRDLIKASLRMRPDRIIIGEVRGPEALDMLQAMNTGHDGSLSTGHANSPADMLTRLETLVLMGTDMPLEAIKRQIASALDILIHLERASDGRRQLAGICEVLDVQNGEITLNPLFFRDEEKNGELVRSSSPKNRRLL